MKKQQRSWVTVSGRASPNRPVMRRRASLASCPEVDYVQRAFYECEVLDALFCDS